MILFQDPGPVRHPRTPCCPTHDRLARRIAALNGVSVLGAVSGS